MFDYSPGTTVSPGVPEEGAGDIEGPLARDHYSFTLAEDSDVYVDTLDEFYGFRYRLVDASTGEEEIATRYGDSQVVQLPAGEYQLEAFGLGTWHSTYSLIVNAAGSG